MSNSRISRAFKDISLSFKPHPVTNDLPVIKNESAIRRSIRNIVQTIPTEKFFDSDFGSDVYQSLFGFVDYGTASIIQDQIETSVRNYEPRVDKVNVEVAPTPDQNSFDVVVSFDIIGCLLYTSDAADE